MSDDEILAYYNEALAAATERLKQLSGSDDPKQATHEQVLTVIREMFDRAADRYGGLPHLTAEQILADHRELTQLKKRRQH
jgi:hypothetical protein